MKKLFLVLIISGLSFFCGYETSQTNLDDINSQINNMTEKSKAYLNMVRYEYKKCREYLEYLELKKQRTIEDLELCYEREKKLYDCELKQEY